MTEPLDYSGCSMAQIRRAGPYANATQPMVIRMGFEHGKQTLDRFLLTLMRINPEIDWSVDELGECWVITIGHPLRSKYEGAA